jgi:hypothetical protein
MQLFPRSIRATSVLDAAIGPATIGLGSPGGRDEACTARVVRLEQVLSIDMKAGT